MKLLHLWVKCNITFVGEIITFVVKVLLHLWELLYLWVYQGLMPQTLVHSTLKPWGDKAQFSVHSDHILIQSEPKL